MAYQVLARKWRPQRFDEVVGQHGVTQTLRNAIATNRIAHAFVFAGPRGVGKTTTARILARGLNCVGGPTPDPCGTCDACVEIAEGRDIDVLEIDAATHTQVDKVREIIIAGLGMAPVRNRYKIFIIDEVHRLSPNAFDALLKSIEEPPPHVVFMMATTELEKVPATIQSRSQVFEFRTIGFKVITTQLRTIADAEQIAIDDAALALIARAADGSLRDAQSALDQVIAFAGQTISAEDVAAVLGLVRRELLLDIADAVAREDRPAVFDLAGRAVESGYDLRLVCRELARLVRDLLVASIDPTRLDDPEIAAEAERGRLKDLAARYSNEDLMRAFDVLARAEYEIRGSTQPRYHLEMALLQWIHLRRLVPLTEIIEALQSGSAPSLASSTPAAPGARAATPPAGPSSAERAGGATPASRPTPAAARTPAPAAPDPDPEPASGGESSELREALLAEIRRSKKFFYGTVVAQAQRIDVNGDRMTFVFAPAHKTLRAQLDQSRPWLESMASSVAGRPVTVTSEEGGARAPGAKDARAAADAAPPGPEDLTAKALADTGVQALLEVFPASITKVEEM